MRRLLEDEQLRATPARERPRARRALHLAPERGGDGGGLPRGDRMTRPDVVACIVSHGQRDLLGPCLEALRADDVPAVVLENIPDGSAALALSLGARASASLEPASFARNQNALDRGDQLALRAGAEPRLPRAPGRGAAARLVRRRASRAPASSGRACSRPTARCSARAGASRRSAGTLVRRTPLRLLRRDIEAAQPDHYLADLPDEPGRVRLDAGRVPARCAARCSTRSAASTRASRCTARTSSCSTARCGRAGSAGTCPTRRRARVPARDRPHAPQQALAVAPAGDGAVPAAAPRGGRQRS